jgi:hypothetical protein
MEGLRDHRVSRYDLTSVAPFVTGYHADLGRGPERRLNTSSTTLPVTSKTQRFPIIVGLRLMIIGTVFGATRLFIICRFLLKANSPRLVPSLSVTGPGSLMCVGHAP